MTNKKLAKNRQRPHTYLTSHVAFVGINSINV
jgi:hypothetical protein